MGRFKGVLLLSRGVRHREGGRGSEGVVRGTRSGGSCMLVGVRSWHVRSRGGGSSPGSSGPSSGECRFGCGGQGASSKQRETGQRCTGCLRCSRGGGGRVPWSGCADGGCAAAGNVAAVTAGREGTAAGAGVTRFYTIMDARTYFLRDLVTAGREGTAAGAGAGEGELCVRRGRGARPWTS